MPINTPVYTMSQNDLMDELQSLKIARSRYEQQTRNEPKEYDVDVYEYLDERIKYIQERIKYFH